jgi:SAM-dependent methyltransferase
MLAQAPTNFFMSLRDIAFWIRSARADAALDRLRIRAATKPTPSPSATGSSVPDSPDIVSSEMGDAFDRLYGATSDPYGAGLPQYRYQRRKYESLLSMLPDRPYRDVLDIGCGLGVLSRRLAPHAQRILGLDISNEAVVQARAASRSHENLDFAQGDVTDFDSGARRFDLIVLADTLYYISPLSDPVLKALAARIADLLAPGGLFLLVNHFFFAVDPASRATRAIHDAFRWSPGLQQVSEHRRAFYLATLLTRQESGQTNAEQL